MGSAVLPIGGTTIITGLLVAAVAGLAASAGIGGGSLFVPLFLILLDLSPQEAVPISHATIFASSVVMVIQHSRRKHPNKSPASPLMDIGAATILAAASISTAPVGVFFNLLLPEAWVGGTLSVLLAYFAYKTTRKGLNIKHAESEKAAITAAGGSIPQTLKDRLIVSDAVQLAHMPIKPIAHNVEIADMRIKRTREYRQQKPADGESQKRPSFPRTHSDTEALMGAGAAAAYRVREDLTPTSRAVKSSMKSIQERGADSHRNDNLPSSAFEYFSASTAEKNRSSFSANEDAMEPQVEADTFASTENFHFRRLEVYRLVAIWVFVLVVPLLLRTLIANKCSATAFVLQFLPLPLGLTVSYFAAEDRLNNPPKSADGDLVLSSWVDARTLITTAAYIGAASGFLGVGGGVLLGPVLLQLGTSPLVITPISSIFVLFTSSASTFQFASQGKLDVAASTAFGLIAAISAAIGVWLAAKKKPYVLVLILGGILFISALSTAIITIIRSADDPHARLAEFNSPC